MKTLNELLRDRQIHREAVRKAQKKQIQAEARGESVDEARFKTLVRRVERRLRSEDRSR